MCVFLVNWNHSNLSTAQGYFALFGFDMYIRNVEYHVSKYDKFDRIDYLTEVFYIFIFEV